MVHEPYIYIQKQVNLMGLAVLILFWNFLYTLILIPKLAMLALSVHYEP